MVFIHMIYVQVVMFLLTLIFALGHSGLASLRDTGEKLVGERAFRVLFAAVSLPLAVSTVVSSWPCFLWLHFLFFNLFMWLLL